MSTSNVNVCCGQVYNNAMRDLLGGSNAPYINDQSAIKHDPAGGHTLVVGVSKVGEQRGRGREGRGKVVGRGG